MKRLTILFLSFVTILLPYFSFADESDLLEFTYVPVIYDAGLLNGAGNQEIRMVKANTNIFLDTNKTQEEYYFMNESANNQTAEMEIKIDNAFGDRFVENLSVQVNDVKIPVAKTTKKKDIHIKNTEDYLVWKVQFKPNEKKKVKIAYDWIINGEINTIVYGISNANSWKGRIEKVCVTVNMGEFSPADIDEILPTKNFRIVNDKMIFEYNNFEPEKVEDDISIEMNMDKTYKYNYSRDYYKSEIVKYDYYEENYTDSNDKPTSEYDEYDSNEDFYYSDAKDREEMHKKKIKQMQDVSKADGVLKSKSSDQAEQEAMSRLLLDVFKNSEFAYCRRAACCSLLNYYKKTNNTEKIKEIYKVEFFDSSYSMVGEIIPQWAYASIAPKSILDSNQNLNGKVIFIDPAHQKSPNKELELLSPNGTKKVMKNSAGELLKSYYNGKVTYNEYKFTLEVAELLKKKLEAYGAKVIMARDCNDVDISNVERTKMANQEQVDLLIKIHANDYCKFTYEDNKTNGIYLYYPSTKNIRNSGIVPFSKMAVQNIMDQVKESLKTGQYFGDYYNPRGLSEIENIASLNWSDFPAVYIETGFMEIDPNPIGGPDMTPFYREKLLDGIVNGLKNYFGSEEAKDYYTAKQNLIELSKTKDSENDMGIQANTPAAKQMEVNENSSFKLNIVFTVMIILVLAAGIIGILIYKAKKGSNKNSN
ncbi:MAG: N-acetylmuramoyl-L-alanine amidase family protein [Ignavibacteriales bacterium]